MGEFNQNLLHTHTKFLNNKNVVTQNCYFFVFQNDWGVWTEQLWGFISKHSCSHTFSLGSAACR